MLGSARTLTLTPTPTTTTTPNQGLQLLAQEPRLRFGQPHDPDQLEACSTQVPHDWVRTRQGHDRVSSRWSCVGQGASTVRPFTTVAWAFFRLCFPSPEKLGPGAFMLISTAIGVSTTLLRPHSIDHCEPRPQRTLIASRSGSATSDKLMRIRTFCYLPPKAGFNWRGQARR